MPTGIFGSYMRQWTLARQMSGKLLLILHINILLRDQIKCDVHGLQLRINLASQKLIGDFVKIKGLASHVQAKKISQGLVGFGCNLAQLIAY